MKNIFTIVIVLTLNTLLLPAQNPDPLSFHFDKKYGQVEVGGPFAGAEFHHSNPLPSRISFYYPVANSIDVSTDYWKRDLSRPMAIGIQVGKSKREWVGREGWNYILSPNTVTFLNRDSILSYSVKYEFCLNEPAMVFSMELKNETDKDQDVTVYSHLLLALRTCQTYARKDSAFMSYQPEHQAIDADFPDADTKFTSVYVFNAGEQAVRIWNDADEISATNSGTSSWINNTMNSGVRYPLVSKRARAIAAYEYKKILPAGTTMRIIEVIGTSNKNRAAEKISLLGKKWKREVDAYNKFVRRKSSVEWYMVTGDRQIDRSALWAKAILATNAHFINGTIEPMPCPAEYNFFFTHDLLMTNLGAVNFDLDRVKKNLLYVASLAKDSIIPHAYYWRDDGFKTEMCTPSNWNHLWFIEVSASYLRHSLDTATVRHLYPLIKKSLSEVLTQRRSDNLMYAYRPDWWDLGWKEGPRTYITVLTIRAIEDYLFIASWIDNGNRSLMDLERDANSMRTALVTKLWDDSLNYLINYNGADKDEHRYMGSLLAPAYHLLGKVRSEKMLETAERDLLAPKIGIRAVMPADFDKDSVIKYFKIAGDEAGKEYTYINGGVWPHNNAWYAIALNSVGRSHDALSFVKQTMTIDGVANSPNGIPAMYEYRYSNPSSSRYGEIDKPSFLWAGGFYLYSLYTLSGFSDNVWNLSLGDNHAQFDSTIRCSYTFGTVKNVELKGKGMKLNSFFVNKKRIASLVLPLDQKRKSEMKLTYGTVTTPYIESMNAILHSVTYTSSRNLLECSVSSFNGHRTQVTIVSSSPPVKSFLDGKEFKIMSSIINGDGSVTTSLDFTAGSKPNTILIQWKKR